MNVVITQVRECFISLLRACDSRVPVGLKCCDPRERFSFFAVEGVLPLHESLSRLASSVFLDDGFLISSTGCEQLTTAILGAFSENELACGCVPRSHLSIHRA